MNQYGDWSIIGWWASIAVAFGIAGFVLGWSWDKRGGGLADISLLNLMTAVGTVGAVLVALHGIASERAAYRKREIAASVRYGKTVFPVLSKFQLRLVALRAPYGQILIGNSHLSEKEFSEMRDVLSTLSILDIDKLSVSYPDAASKLMFVITLLGQASFLHTNDPHRNITVTVDSLLEKALELLHAVCFEIASKKSQHED